LNASSTLKDVLGGSIMPRLMSTVQTTMHTADGWLKNFLLTRLPRLNNLIALGHPQNFSDEE